MFDVSCWNLTSWCTVIYSLSAFKCSVFIFYPVDESIMLDPSANNIIFSPGKVSKKAAPRADKIVYHKAR